MKISLSPEALLLPSPVWAVGSYGPNEQPNMMIVAWGAICCSSPPCLSIALKKSRATYANIIEHGAFTINVPSQKFLSECDYVGTVSGISTDKFSVTGLTAAMSKLVHAPYIQDFPLIAECKLLHILEIGSHTQFIGQIMDVKAEANVLGMNGLPVARKVDPLLCSAPERSYYGLGNFLDQTTFPGAVLLESQENEDFI